MLNPAITINDPDLIKDVLIKDHFSFHVNEQNFNKRYDPLTYPNPFVATNEQWRKGRNALTPLLTKFKVNIKTITGFIRSYTYLWISFYNQIRNMHPAILKSCEKLVHYLRSIPEKKDIEAKAVRYFVHSFIYFSFDILQLLYCLFPNTFVGIYYNK